jgi:hypothetical protein
MSLAMLPCDTCERCTRVSARRRAPAPSPGHLPLHAPNTTTTRAIIVTSNQGLGAWGEVFGDSVIAAAILDRLLHHSITVNIKGESYRLREKLKAGLLKPKLGVDRGSDADAAFEKP